MTCRHFATLMVCLVLSALLAMGCGPSESDLPLDLPGVDATVIASICDPAGPEFAAFLTSASTDQLIALRIPLLVAGHGRRGDSTDESQRLEAILAGVDQALTQDRGLPTYLQESRYLESLPDSLARRVIEHRQEMTEVFAAPEVAISDKVDRIRSLGDELDAAGDEFGALDTWTMLAALEHRRGDFEMAMAHRRSGIHHARRLGRLADVCQHTGQFLMGRMENGWSDAERDTLLQLAELAQRARLARMSSHLIMLQGYDAFNRGHYFTARTTFEDAIEVCRRFGEPAASLPTMVTLLRMYATLECWDQVAILLSRTNGLFDELVGDQEMSARQRLSRVQLDILEASRLAALGRTDQAQQIFRRTFATACELPFEEASYVGWQWFEAMLDQDRPDLAAAALDVVEPYAIANEREYLIRRSWFWRGWLLWRAGDLAGAEAHLAEFGRLLADGSPGGQDVKYQYLALQARILQTRNAEAAGAILLEGWQGLQSRLARQEPGAEAYLDLNRNPHLRRAAHEFAAGDAELGYGVELLWRDAMLLQATSLDEVEDLFAAARAKAVTARQRLARAGSVHCVYRVDSEVVTRWTADSRGVELTTLPVPTDTLRARVRALLAQLATDPLDLDAPTPPALQQDLADLARVLLPSRFQHTSALPRTMFVSGDGFLAQLPFAPLHVGDSHRYEPLILSTDVVWLRHGPAWVTARGTETVLAVGNPALNSATRRRFSLAGGLQGAKEELRRLADALPTVDLIEGDDATREQVLAAWDRADVFYFVGHAVADPQVPFAAWLPLASLRAQVTYPGIGTADILAQRFRRCRVVLLSGCATGLPHVDGMTIAPSLGDAFLDAGVQAAVQTFWPVRDSQLLIRPERALVAWREGRADIAAAMAAEQRRALRGPNGIRHPFSWAAWTVKVRGL